ncbi:TPA: hypothetical protein ACSPKR_004061 [Providencia rettgeri]
MKGTTLLKLNEAYNRQTDFIASKTIKALDLGCDSSFFEIRYQKRKLHPRGKVFIKLLKLCGEERFYD